MSSLRLDDLLGAWAAQRRLTDVEAQAIGAAIIEQAQSALPATWWGDFSEQLSNRIVRATNRPVRIRAWAA